MFNSKKGQEMSVTVLVGIILGIIMLGAAMFLFFNIMSKTNKTSDQLDEQTRAKIVQALDSGEPVYVPMTNVDVKKGSASFWIGIKNINGEPKNFIVTVTTLTNPVPANFNEEGIAYLSGPYTINAKESQMVNVAVGMKGVTSKVALLVNVGIKESGIAEPVQYGKPKIVYIQP